MKKKHCRIDRTNCCIQASELGYTNVENFDKFGTNADPEGCLGFISIPKQYNYQRGHCQYTR